MSRQRTIKCHSLGQPHRSTEQALILAARRRRAPSAPSLRRFLFTFQINHYFPNNVCARSQYWAWGGRTAPHLRRGTPRPPRGMASTPQRPPPPQRPPGPKSLLLGRPRNRSLRHLRGPEPPTRRLQPILPRKPSRTAAGRAEERRRGRGDRSAAEEAIEHPLVSAVPEQPLGALFRALFIIYHHISNSPYHRAIVAR